MFGSINYVFVTGSDFIEVLIYWKKKDPKVPLERIKYITSSIYAIGSSCFLIGSVFSLSLLDQVEKGAWLYIIGSRFFIIGVIFNLFQIIKVDKLINLLLFNFTLICFLLGSVLFFVSSIPYLWSLSASAKKNLETLGAAQYFAGGLFFLLGGLLISHRKNFQHSLKPHRSTLRIEKSFLRSLKNQIKHKGNLSQFKSNRKNNKK